MDVTQVATLVNNVNQEIIGASAILEEDLSNVVDVGKAVFDSTSYDKYVAALVDHIGKVIFVDRKYAGELGSLYRDSWEYGAVMEKIYVTDMPVAIENDTWKLTNGTSYDPNVFTQPSVAAKFYNKKSTFEVDLSIADIQVRSAFDSATQLNDDMLHPLIDDMLARRREALEEVNAMFGTNITVDFNSAWETNELEEDLTLEQMESVTEDMTTGEEVSPEETTEQVTSDDVTVEDETEETPDEVTEETITLTPTEELIADAIETAAEIIADAIEGDTPEETEEQGENE